MLRRDLKTILEEAIFFRAENKQKKRERASERENINWEMMKIVFANVNMRWS